MIRIGQQVGCFRLPGLVHGSLTYVDFRQYRGNWIALCFLSSVGLLDALILDGHAQAFAQEATSLLAVGLDPRALAGSCSGSIAKLRIPILADPLRQLHRAYGIGRTPTPGRCRSFLIGPDGKLRFYLVHDLNGKGVSALLEMIGLSRRMNAPMPAGVST